MENYRQALVSSTLPQIWSFHIHVSEMYQNMKRMSDQYSVLSNRERFPQYDLVTLNRLFCGVLVPCLSALVLYHWHIKPYRLKFTWYKFFSMWFPTSRAILWSFLGLTHTKLKAIVYRLSSAIFYRSQSALCGSCSPRGRPRILGSLSKHDGDGSENVIWKCNFAFLQSIFSYSKSLCLKNVF